MFSRWIVLAGLALIVSANTAAAEQPTDRRPASTSPMSPEISLTEIKPTPEMWFYLQERQRHDTPSMLVHRSAEIEAAQRAERLSAMHWLRQSSQRPSAYATPFGVYFPGTFPYGNADQWNYYLSIHSTGLQPALR